LLAWFYCCNASANKSLTPTNGESDLHDECTEFSKASVGAVFSIDQ